MFIEHMLDYTDARELLDFIIEQAAGRQIAIAVVDLTGRLLAVASINGVGQHYTDFAIAKAMTALHEELNTVDFRFIYEEGKYVERVDNLTWAEWELTHAAQLRPGFCGWAGGTVVNNPNNPDHIVGAIGVSGLSELEDHELSFKRPEKWLY